MGLFGRLKGNDGGKATIASNFVIGEDKRFSRRPMESTGVYYQDRVNRLAYDTCPGAIGQLIRKANGQTRVLGPISIAYEPTSHLFHFPTLTWAEERHKEDVILDTSFAEGIALAVQREGREEWMNKLTTILLLAVMGAVVLLLLIAGTSGTLTNTFQKLPGFFGR